MIKRAAKGLLFCLPVRTKKRAECERVSGERERQRRAAFLIINVFDAQGLIY